MQTATTLLALGLGSWPSAAGAQPTRTEAFSSLPMTRYREAHTAMARDDWQAAREVLLELWGRSQSYDVAASLGQVEHKLGNNVAAAHYLTFAVAHLAPKERPETLTLYRAALDELEGQIGRIQVSVSHDAADLRIDGTLVGVSPLTSPVFVEPGEHTVEARLADSVVSKRVQVAKGSWIALELSLAQPAPEPSAMPPTPAPTAFATLRAEVTPFPAEVSGSRSSVPLYVGGGLTLAGLGMAIGFGIAANADEAKANALRARLGPTACSSGTATRSACDAADRAVEAQRRDALLSTIGIGVASVAAVTSVGYLLFWPKPKPSSARVRVRPSGGWTRTGAALGLLGEF